MGYASPRQNINQSLGVINDQIATNQNKMDLTFANLRNMYIGQIEDNQAFEAAEAERRALGIDKWDKAVAKAQEGVEGGFNEVVSNFVMDKGDEYYDLIGDNSKEGVRRRRELEGMLGKISAGQGAYMADQEAYLKAAEIEEGKPGSISKYNSDAASRSFAAEGALYNYAGITLSEKGGNVTWHNKSSVDGKTYNMSNNDYIQNALKGQGGINTVGDPTAFMTELGKGVKAETNYDQVTTVNDQTNPEEHTKVVKMENEKLANAMAQPNLYKSALANQKEMRRMFPTLVSSVEQAAKDENHPNYDQARKLMYGDDMKPGGVNIEGGAQNADFIAEQEGAYTQEQIDEAGVDANAMLGQWVSDPKWPNRNDMDEIAILGFQLNLPENFYVEDKTTQIDLNAPVDDSPSYSEITARMNAVTRSRTQEQQAQVDKLNKLSAAEKRKAVADKMGTTDEDLINWMNGMKQPDEGAKYHVIDNNDGTATMVIRSKEGDTPTGLVKRAQSGWSHGDNVSTIIEGYLTPTHLEGITEAKGDFNVDNY